MFNKPTVATQHSLLEVRHQFPVALAFAVAHLFPAQ